jgi:signal-transduction protein with cAMP-binding, CBS, and nucleotidyltransferase domain/PAS domain-containing protein
LRLGLCSITFIIVIEFRALFCHLHTMKTLLQVQWRHFGWHIMSPVILTFALSLGLIFLVVMPAMKRHIIDHKKEMIRELTQAAWSELAGLHEQEQRGTLTREAAQQAAIARIQGLRYGDDAKDYFWITDDHPRMIMHPYRPELNGRDLSDYADPAKKKLFVAFAELVRAQGDGYTDYLWQWKDDEHRVAPKLSYVKGFKPWGWIIGTGIYLEDVRAEIAQVTRRVLSVSVGISLIIGCLLAYIANQGLSIERKRQHAETALRASEEKYRLLIEGTTEGILMILKDRPVYANKTLLDRLGYTEQELAELSLDRIIEPINNQHARLIGKDGQTADVLLSSSPVQIGSQAGQVLSLRDVTAQKKTEETLQRLLAELQTTLPLTMRPVKASPLVSLSCPLDTPIQKAAMAMSRAKVSAILVTAPSGEPVGIVTHRDLLDRVLAASRDTAQSVATIMSAPLVRIPEHALLFEAARMMQEQSIQHLVVTDERGGTRGILSSSDILHAQRHAVGLLLSEIEQAQSPEPLRDCYQKLPCLIRFLLDAGTRIEHITRIMSSVADAITNRLIGLAEAELGPPPVPYTFLALGSAARGEQTLATDQDNAIIYANVTGDQHAAAQTYFLKLGDKVCGWLDQVGYRRCLGGTMASNPKWCQPLDRWREYFTACITAAGPQDLLDVNIFFDFRCIHGEAGHVAELRRHLEELLRDGQPVFFFHLSQSTLQYKAPCGFFGNIQLESGGDHPATFNIKNAIVPLVNFARMYALRHHIAETNTLERLQRLRDMGILVPSSHNELVQAYTSLMQMRLAHQAGEVVRHVAPDNYITLAELTQLEQSFLKKVFADITVFQARLETDFTRTS